LFESLSKREFGFKLEAFAVGKLKCLDCHIIETNFQCKLGEIDIILKDKETLVFVEVRYRKQNKFGGASASVDRRKQNKIIKTASHYLQSKNINERFACRFDVFAIESIANQLSYNWIKDAFDVQN